MRYEHKVLITSPRMLSLEEKVRLQSIIDKACAQMEVRITPIDILYKFNLETSE